MNYRKLFIFAVVLNVALASGAYWIWKSSRSSPNSTNTAEHPPMEGFTINTPPEASAPEIPSSSVVTPAESFGERPIHKQGSADDSRGWKVSPISRIQTVHGVIAHHHVMAGRD